MISGLGSSGSASSLQRMDMFSRLDTDQSGAVSKQEFIDGAPDDVSADKAASLFDSLDQSGSGSLSASDLASAFQQMSANMQAGLLQAQEFGGPPPSGQGGPGGAPPDANELFSQIDTDGDGTVTREEFVNGRPDDLSADQADAMFTSLAGESADSLSQSDFVAAMENGPQGPGGPPPGPPPQGQSAQSDSDDDSAQTALDQLLQDFLAQVSKSGSTNSQSLSSQFLAAMDAYSGQSRSSGWSTGLSA